MIIEEKDCSKVSIEDLKYGDVFLGNGRLFLKIRDPGDYMLNSKQSITVDLENNTLTIFAAKSKVTLVKAKVIYEYI